MATHLRMSTKIITLTILPSSLTKEEAEKLLFEYKKDSTKLTKCTHHYEFLSQCRKDHKVPRGLQLKLELNIVDQDPSLLRRIKGILTQAELEILEETINNYEEETYRQLCQHMRQTQIRGKR